MRTMLFLTILCFLSCGTDQGETNTYTYIVRNESGVDVKIVGYVRFPNQIEEYIITLNNNEERTQIYKDGLPPRGYHFRYLFGSTNGNFDANSVKIVYNNTKFKVYNNENLLEERNPLGPNHNEGALEATYTLTPDDYENAEDCNGNCE